MYIFSFFYFLDRDARYTKWKMAVQRSLGWATTKKSIVMTGQTKRKHSITNNELPSPTQSRKQSLIETIDCDNPTIDEGIDDSIDELIKYSARKFSVFVPVENEEKTILDDMEYFMNKKECDYGMCQCCQPKRKLTNWETIEEIIENDPEIIFDSDDNPIVVENVLPVGSSVVLGNPVNKVPEVFTHICNKLSHTTLM